MSGLGLLIEHRRLIIDNIRPLFSDHLKDFTAFLASVVPVLNAKDLRLPIHTNTDRARMLLNALSISHPKDTASVIWLLVQMYGREALGDLLTTIRRVVPITTACVVQPLATPTPAPEPHASEPPDKNLNMYCVVCMENQKTELLNPCMHLCMCANSTHRVMTNGSKTCPMCRQAIASVQHAYI